MICTSVFKLCCCNIQNTLSCAVRNQMYETKQILTGITESHASSDTGFEVGSRTAHIKCDHTLILMPDVYHTIQFFLGRGYRKVRKQFIPVFFSSASAASDFSLVSNSFIRASARVRLIFPSSARPIHFSSTGFSMYARINTKVLDSLGARDTFR